MELGFHGLHRVLRQGDARLIGRGHQVHDGVTAVPRHRPGKLEHSVNRVQQGPIPMIFQDTPTALDRIILAVIGWIVRQPDRDAILLDKRNQPLHKLRPPAMVFWTIIHIEH